MNVLNAYNTNLVFTKEVEQDGKLPFLDMIIHNEKCGKLKTSWYMKAYGSGRILSFLSKHSRAQLMGTAKGLMNRAVTLTDGEYLTETVMNITSILQKNNYSKRVIDKLFDDWLADKKDCEKV